MTGLRCLWIARDLPFPLKAGDRIYSGNLARSLALAGFMVRFMGFSEPGAPAPPPDFQLVEWIAVPGFKRGKLAGLFSSLPVQGAAHATREYKKLLACQLRERWDVIVLDSYGSGWALPLIKASQASAGAARRPKLAHISHNFETTLWHAIATASDTSFVRRLLLTLNARRVRRLEERLVRAADLVTTITDDDNSSVRALAGHTAVITLNPGYAGPRLAHRKIDASMPRRVVLFGSFYWVAKEENLRQFLRVADPLFAASNIHLDVVGHIEAPVREELQRACTATTLHGFVQDPAPILASARLALVPELIGGGFKLKFLDYAFMRIPIATIGAAAQCLPRDLRDSLLCSDDLQALALQVVKHCDDYTRLNELHESAYRAAESLFRWEDRGITLRTALGTG